MEESPDLEVIALLIRPHHAGCEGQISRVTWVWRLQMTSLYTHQQRVPFVPANHQGWRKGEFIAQPKDQNRNPKSELAVLET